MKMVARLLVRGVAVAALATAPARAQQVQFRLTPSDTALTILTADTGMVDLRVSGGSGVSAYSIVVFFDAARIQLARADTVPGGYNLPVPTVTPGVDQVTLSASGTGSTAGTVDVARLWFTMDPSATSGSLISVRVDVLTDGLGADVLASHTTQALNVCQSEVLRGDVTGDRQVTSRDALVTLTAAVGLAVAGFQVMPGGDVDLDLAATSRDALFMLSTGIGLSTGYEGNVRGIANACAPLLPAPADLVFFSGSSLYRIYQGDTLPQPWIPSLAPYDAYAPQWSPDGTRILYTAYTGPYYYEIVAFDTASGVVDTLTRSPYYDAGADWAPDGSRIAYISYGTDYAVFVMNANGTGQTQITSGVSVNTAEPVSWSPDGTRIAFVGCQTCGGYGIWVVSPDGSGLTEVVPGSLAHAPEDPVWSAAGDSIYYRRSGGFVHAAAAVAAATPVRESPLVGGHDYPAASPLGAAFRVYLQNREELVVRRAADGRHLWLHHDPDGTDTRFSFRRTAGLYVDTVSVSPDTLDLSVSDQPTGTLAAAVRNNDGSPSGATVTWISRAPAVVTVDQAGLVTASDTTSVGVFVVATVGGWRSDSALVRVSP